MWMWDETFPSTEEWELRLNPAKDIRVRDVLLPASVFTVQERKDELGRAVLVLEMCAGWEIFHSYMS